MDLKTAFLQGEEYDAFRDVVCQLPPESGQPPHMAARLKKPAYGMNDAPRKWWNRLDGSIRSYGLIPTRADRCCYVQYQTASAVNKSKRGPDLSTASKLCEEKRFFLQSQSLSGDQEDILERALGHLLDPVTGSPAKGNKVQGVVLMHIDDLLVIGSDRFRSEFIAKVRKDYQIGSETLNEASFCGQRMRWQGSCLIVDQDKAIEEIAEIVFDKSLKDDTKVNSLTHTEYRRALGQLNWVQSRTQYHTCYRFSRAASASASPTIGDVKYLNKVIRGLRARPVRLYFWPLRGSLRIMGLPDASFQNNEDKSSQRGQCVFLAEERVNQKTDTRGSLIDYESKKIKRTTLSTTVAELYSFMKCYGTCQFLRGLWMDLSGSVSPIHMRTDANNLVSTAASTHLPEQPETVHTIQMLRRETCSGDIADLSHVRTEHCLSDSLTKHSAKPDTLIQSVETGFLRQVDCHPLFRTTLQHKAFCATADSLSGESLAIASRDHWEHDKAAACLIRHHVVPRRRLFSPWFSTPCPVDTSMLSPQRESQVAFLNGGHQIIHDSWINPSTSLETLWTGRALFHLAGRDE